MSDTPASLEAQLASLTAAHDGALRELESLRARIASADEIHRRAHQRDSEHQRTIDALAAAELNLKAARTAEAQANARAAAAESAAARGNSQAASPDPESVMQLERQLGEARRREDTALADAADLRNKLAAAREQVTAVASDEALASLRESAGKAAAELHAVNAQNAVLRRELDTARARTAQLESAAVTIQARLSGPPPELAEARSEAEKARHAARSAEGTINKLRRDLTDAQTRLKGIETTLAAARAASASNLSAATDLAAAKKQAAQLRSDLLAVSEENRRLKQELSGKAPQRPAKKEGEAAAKTPAADKAGAQALPRGLVWKFFTQLAEIPRESKKEDRAVEWLIRTGQEIGCEVETQPLAGPDRPHFANVLLRKAATPGREHLPVMAMQAHIDMVCEKNEGVAHDFSTDAIKLRVQGDNLWATDTTLGADNGIGVCAGLAILADRRLEHGPLELIVTVDEEAGMTGARHLKAGWLKAKYLLNLDSEEEGEATISCAGALDSIGSRPVSRASLDASHGAWALKVRGLRGGHSGLNIGEGRGNAMKVLAAVWEKIAAATPVQLISLSGGNKRNAIPREATAVLAAEVSQAAVISDIVAREAAALRESFGSIEPDLAVTVEPAEAAAAMSAEDTAAVLGVLLELPNAVQAMSAEVPGLVETSTNLAIASTTESAVEISLLSRSSVDASKRALGDAIAALFQARGFTVREDNDYPGWKPQPESDIVRILKQTHQEVFTTELKIAAIHAGLECGLIGQGYPDMQMISFGPNMWGVHTPQEHVSIPSVYNFMKLLRAVISHAG